jgi:hypothetical protein
MGRSGSNYTIIHNVRVIGIRPGNLSDVSALIGLIPGETPGSD